MINFEDRSSKVIIPLKKRSHLRTLLLRAPSTRSRLLGRAELLWRELPRPGGWKWKPSALKFWQILVDNTCMYIYIYMYSLTMVNGETIRWLIYQIYQIYDGLTLVRETHLYFYWHLCNLCACYLTMVNSILTIHWMSILTAWSPVLPSLLWESPSFPGKTSLW